MNDWTALTVTTTTEAIEAVSNILTPVYNSSATP